MKTAREVAEGFLQLPFGVEPKDFGEMISYVDKMAGVLSEIIRKDREEVREEAAMVADGYEPGRVYAFLPPRTVIGEKIRSIEIK